ncbi:MAG: hypothetical protein H6627_08315 [Calditrichae bacterium]|nr:hypothetical protein [Calditrichia bacterium]
MKRLLQRMQKNKDRSIPGKISKIFLLTFILLSVSYAKDNKIGDNPDGSRAIPVHVIKLIDPDSSVIWLDETPLMPFSTEKTCGACHSYQTVRKGWHFNAGDSGVAAGRNGQPWIYSDPYSASQIPLSMRDWQGAFKPAQIGMSNFDYIARFGRQMPGGSVGDDENAQSLEMFWRWQVSGKQEINCLSCHDAERSHDQAEYAAHIIRQNFRWAATAASGFASVKGSAKDMPDNYDIYAGSATLPSRAIEPAVSYQSERFNDKSEVFFDITRDVPDERCYFCHSNKTIDSRRTETWHFDEDVHLKAGMHCVDCHRNGLDHDITRGYADDSRSDMMQLSLTCKGCHLGTDDNTQFAGRLGAPKPLHEGIPAIHFEKLSCTSCHSGNRPEENLLQLKTSMAHGIGLHKTNKNDQVLPHIITPVFVENENGVIEPNNLLWPSYWATLDSNKLVPLEIQLFAEVTRPIIAHLDSLGTGDWPVLADSTLSKVLDSLQTKISRGKAVYVSAGKIFYLDDQNNLRNKDHEQAKPYTWPIAHDVRPASQALGMNGCADCHSLSSPFYFADIRKDTALKQAGLQPLSMTDLMGQNYLESRLFSFSFLFRPWLKYLMFVCSFILIAVIIIYGFKGFSRILTAVSENEKDNSTGR